MGNALEGLGTGWLQDYPDYRDYTMEHADIAPMMSRLSLAEPEAVTMPGSVDWRSYCSPIENQGPIGSCTAQAGVGLMEYYERRAFHRHIDASRLFLYKATRNLLGWTGDTGAFLRSTMGAMVLFGAPPEKYWPYVTADYDEEPSAFCYSFAESYKAVKYFRLDPPGTPRNVLLMRIKGLLAAGLPSMFGFTVYSSIGQAGQTGNDGKIPFPGRGESILGGHAVVAIGFDDSMRIVNTVTNAATKGALIIRNSWGTGWGDHGYGYLPYDYITRGLAVDWWTLLKSDWVDTKNFGF